MTKSWYAYLVQNYVIILNFVKSYEVVRNSFVKSKYIKSDKMQLSRFDLHNNYPVNTTNVEANTLKLNKV